MYPYLCSGGYLGPARAMAALFDALPWDMATDDQRYFTDEYFRTRGGSAAVPWVRPPLPPSPPDARPHIVLDHGWLVFAAVNGVPLDTFGFTGGAGEWAMGVLKTRPQVIHMNGGNKRTKAMVHAFVAAGALPQALDRYVDASAAADRFRLAGVFLFVGLFLVAAQATVHAVYAPTASPPYNAYPFHVDECVPNAEEWAVGSVHLAMS